MAIFLRKHSHPLPMVDGTEFMIRGTTVPGVILLYDVHVKVYPKTLKQIFFLSPPTFQIEERAIQDLLVFYEAFGNPDEFVIVERTTQGPLAVPMWNKHGC